MIESPTTSINDNLEKIEKLEKLILNWTKNATSRRRKLFNIDKNNEHLKIELIDLHHINKLLYDQFKERETFDIYEMIELAYSEVEHQASYPNFKIVIPENPSTGISFEGSYRFLKVIFSVIFEIALDISSQYVEIHFLNHFKKVSISVYS